MGAQQNIRLAGDARRRQAEGLTQRRASAPGSPSDNPTVLGERQAMSPNAVFRQEQFAPRPGVQTPIQTQGVEFSQGITTNPNFSGTLADGSPAYEQMKERLRGLSQLRNTGGRI
jgi:hypothetical protein